MKPYFLAGAAACALAACSGFAQAPALSAGSTAVNEPEGEAIIVTARRREESLQDAPVAISAFSPQILEDRQIHQTSDLEQITPSLQFKPAGQLSGNTA